MVLAYLLAAIAVAGATALSALLAGATFGTALWLYAGTGMATLLGLPILIKSYELAAGLLNFARAESGTQELRLIEYHGKRP
ncbi:MAG: hypothetical protein AB3N11_16550 [Arenibacterium sp.]